MKITRRQLRHVINEEISRLHESKKFDFGTLSVDQNLWVEYNADRIELYKYQDNKVTHTGYWVPQRLIRGRGFLYKIVELGNEIIVVAGKNGKKEFPVSEINFNEEDEGKVLNINSKIDSISKFVNNTAWNNVRQLGDDSRTDKGWWNRPGGDSVCEPYDISYGISTERPGNIWLEFNFVECSDDEIGSGQESLIRYINLGWFKKYKLKMSSDIFYSPDIDGLLLYVAMDDNK